MADDNWKTRVGIEINFSSEDEETSGTGTRKVTADGLSLTLSPASCDSPDSSFEGRRFFNDDILSRYADYGSTPPRTKISRRQRERKQRADEKINGSGAAKSAPKVIHAQAARRNTLDSIYFAELLERSDLSESPQTQVGGDRSSRGGGDPGKANNKRAMQLQRGSERDLKLDIPGPGRQPPAAAAAEMDDRAESLPVMVTQPAAIKVETCNRFMSLSSKLVACNKFRRGSATGGDRRSDPGAAEDQAEGGRSGAAAARQDFFNTFSLLIKMGGGDKQADKNPRRTISREELVWQNELKDMIWLELQACQAGRTLTEQDVYLCQAREGIDPLLKDIIDYRFSRPSACCPPPAAAPHPAAPACAGCLSMFCHGCNDAQEAALAEVEALLSRLEAAEALYPSSKVFAEKHPLYKCPSLVGRVKAMCLWYNVTVHHRLKLRILGKLLTLTTLAGGGGSSPAPSLPPSHWPMEGGGSSPAPSLPPPRWPGEGGGSQVDEGIGTDGSDEPPAYARDLLRASRSSSVEDRHKSATGRRTVQFDVDSSSPSDSNNSNASNNSNHSNASHNSNNSNVSHDSNNSNASSEADAHHKLKELYHIKSMSAPGPSIFNSSGDDPSTKNPYRKYIEEVLKTRGLRKALAFLESLHTVVLLKAMLTLEKPREGEGDTAQDSLPCVLLDEAETEETRRYGYWSPETRALALPSYRSAFLFLSRIPLDVIHEFLRMRLEQKPNQPSVLSIRQLMRELKEGLGIAVLHRDRYLHLIRAVLWDVDPETLSRFEAGVREYDASVRAVLEVYLDYLRRWVRMVQQECVGKRVLEEEWLFVKSVGPRIRDCEALAGNSFCQMGVGLLSAIGDHLLATTGQLSKNMTVCEKTDDDSSPKYCMLSVCRDMQSLFNVSRVRALKALLFAKTLRKDLEEDSTQVNPDVAESLQQLKVEALVLCGSVAHTISAAERMCDCRDWLDVDELDRAALLARCREILHQAYKFGFEYHKEACKLVTGESRAELSRALVSFARLWMSFVRERCDRGRGLRPRWANQGLEFLMYVCEPQLTDALTDDEFEELKTAMDQCISHVVGQPPATPPDNPPSPLPSSSPRPSVEYPRSPLPIRHKLRTSRSGSGLGHRRTPSGNVVPDENVVDGSVVETIAVPVLALTRHERVMNAVAALERDADTRLKASDLIGCVVRVDSQDKIHVRLRSVTFGWQRGIKIGQGSYGKVYTAVNNQTGELMAMKEIQLQPNDHRTIRRVAEELRIFEGIKHRHLVRYYGVEIHREEMLIFMEFCAEGTLESLVAGTESGLPEALIRRYTRQLLQAVDTLHKHGIVHRDVKSANVFLTDEGNCLKLGDFGSAVKIKAHTTVPGELQGFVGTQAYMAPEVFMKSTSEGHGRAVDIWSLGCVVVEMASGERPWAEFDSNYQIMFKVGMGESPAVADSLSDEGHDFLALCLKHDPRERASANQLLQHAFSKVESDEENLLSLTIPL